MTPIHVACQLGHATCLSLLIEKGGDLEAKCVSGYLPIRHAIVNFHLSCIEVIVKEKGEEVLEWRDLNGESIFHWACLHNTVEVLRFLINSEFGILSEGIESRDINGRTPLLVACSVGSLDCVEYLYECGYCDTNQRCKS